MDTLPYPRPLGDLPFPASEGRYWLKVALQGLPCPHLQPPQTVNETVGRFG